MRSTLLASLLCLAMVALGCASTGTPSPTVENRPEDSTETTAANPAETPGGGTTSSAPTPEEPSQEESSAGSESSIVDTSIEIGADAGVEALTGPLTTSERTAVLDGELDRSLEEFDGLILREQELLEQKRADNAETASGFGGLGSSGRGEGSREYPTGGEDGGVSGGGNAGNRVSAGAEQEISEQDKARTPPDVGDGSDDDIVARQLREAAVAEDDPELREKLWEEYRRYKGGS